MTKKDLGLQNSDRHIFAIIILVMLMLFGMYTFQMGHHNIDLAYNILIIDSDMTDMTLQGVELNSYEMYGIGWWQVRLGGLIIFATALWLGILIGNLLKKDGRKKGSVVQKGKGIG